MTLFVMLCFCFVLFCSKVHWTIRSNLIDSLGGDPYVFVRISTEDNKNIKTGLTLNINTIIS